MHINGIKPGAVEGRRHFHMGVNPLLTQHRDTRTHAFYNIRRSDIVILIECQYHIKARVCQILLRFMLFIRTGRVITLTLHLPGGFCPHDPQFTAGLVIDFGIMAADNKIIPRYSFTENMQHICQTGTGEGLHNAIQIRFPHLEHGTRLFGKQCAKDILIKCTDIRIHTAVSGKGHFRQGNKQAAI